MAYQGLKNATPFIAEPLLLADEQGRDVLVVMVKATYAIAPGGAVQIAPVQAPLCLAGAHHGEPDKSSLKHAPEGSFAKVATDVILIGQAHAPNGRAATQVDVTLRIGALHKTVRVFGDRMWKLNKGLFGASWKMSAPQPFTTLPLVYERAFGGQDTTADDPNQHEYEPRNLVGTGYIATSSKKEEQALPNLEDPVHLIQKITDRPPPSGFGAIAAHWQPRLKHAGTYDDAWQKARMPLLPTDFDPKFFNAAHPSLIAPGFLSGNERVEIDNASPEGRLAFYLPGNAPEFKLTMSGESAQPLTTQLDTVTINTDERTVQLLWRASANVYQRLYDIELIEVSALTLALNKVRAA